jgi:hypothetical protein
MRQRRVRIPGHKEYGSVVESSPYNVFYLVLSLVWQAGKNEPRIVIELAVFLDETKLLAGSIFNGTDPKDTVQVEWNVRVSPR